MTFKCLQHLEPQEAAKHKCTSQQTTTLSSLHFLTHTNKDLLVWDKNPQRLVGLRGPAVSDVQVLGERLVVCCHGNSLFQPPIWLKLKDSADLKN